MRYLLIGAVLLTAGVGGPLRADDAVWEDEVERLRDEVVRLQFQVLDLTRHLTEVMAADESDDSSGGERAGWGASDLAAGFAVSEDEGQRVIAVDNELDIVALSGGFDQRLLVGMQGALIREDQVVARVRLVDVRQQVSGAVVTRRVAGVTPEPGDRLLIGK